MDTMHPINFIESPTQPTLGNDVKGTYELQSNSENLGAAFSPSFGGVGEASWFMACYADDVPENGGVCVKHGDEQIAIFNFSRRGEWFATQNLCPHKRQMALSRGMIGSQAGEPKVACPFHKKTFSLQTGECLSGDECAIKTYGVRVMEGKIYINTNTTPNP